VQVIFGQILSKGFTIIMKIESYEIGSVHEVTITGYGSGGEGVGRLEDGKVCFVRGGARGDVLEVRLTNQQARISRGDLLRIITPSKHRIEPDCPVYPICGGCDFRHIAYEEELGIKLKRVNDAFERIGGLSGHVDEILATGKIDGYRNKAVLHCNGKSWGFYAAGSHDVVPITRCALLKGDLNYALNGLNADGEKGEITLRSGRNGMTPPIEEEHDGLVFRISGFFQVNSEAALLLFNKAREYAAMSKNETLVDLYCGVGSLTIFFFFYAGRAIGVEIKHSSVRAARDNAVRNGFSHIEFIDADAAKWNSSGIKADCVIVDPPRSGLSKSVLKKLKELSPERIVYVSCDPATLARDIRLLEDYSPAKACAVDMFPRTANIESCCLLVKG
jgi:23S rRNA (uracil1939-C5)-methyltransferase